MSGLRTSVRVKGWLGIVAVLSNLLASVLCMAQANAMAAAEDGPAPVILCTEHGLQVLPGSDPVGGGRQDQRDGKGIHCIACTLLAGLAIAVALVFAAIAFPARVVHAFKSAARTLADHLSLGGIRSRAPPLPA